MNLETRVEQLEQQIGMAQRGCPLCSQASEEAEEQAETAVISSDYLRTVYTSTIKTECPKCGGPRLITYQVIEPSGLTPADIAEMAATEEEQQLGR